MAVLFEELAGSPRQSVSLENWSGTREFVIQWSDIDEFIVELLGQTRRIQGNVQQITPAGFPGRPLAVCSSINIEPFVPNPSGAEVTLSGVANTYTYAKITATYTLKPRAFNAPDGTYMTWDQSHDVEVMMTPGRNWKFDGIDEEDGPNLGEDQPYPILIAVTNHSLRWERVASPPWSAIQACRGTVNSGAFMGAIPGSLLFKGARTTTTFDVIGQVRYNLEYTFIEKTVQSTVGISISDASGSPITFNTGSSSYITSGDYISVSGVLGNKAANGVFRVASASTGSVTVDGVNSNGAYSGGGKMYKLLPQWNYFWREKADSDGEHWFRLVDAEDGSATPYTSNDFGGLFEYGSRLGGDLTVDG